ncbi:hypothetical protein [Paenibacillus agilis]|uniref:Uncharacterized protein n=1 Tax=Paenibacillus agilis TaxID=3020863 RepID=A0A559IKA1_9BACL|nr:hypothetical protein [Paenibacillus agilis]TVX88084.1 hypothetical protein FPZ44_19425 [Paenibacillus agilis]
MNESNYKAGIEGLRTSKDFEEKTLVMLHSKSNERYHRKEVHPMRKRTNIWGAVLASVAVAAFILLVPALSDHASIALHQSSDGVSVQYVNDAPIVQTSGSLVPLTEEEIFKKPNMSVFKGTVEKIQNIEMELGKGDAYYQAIATIKVDEVYQGNEKIGEPVQVLLPTPIDSNVWVEDTDVVSAMRVGMTGIFMPVKYEGTEKREENGETLVFKDISDYGLLDGERFAFLQTDTGLIFSKDTYTSLSHAQTLEDVKKFVSEVKAIK